MKLIDKIESRFKNRTLLTGIVVFIIGYFIVELIILIRFALSGGSLKPIFIWLVSNYIRINIGLLIIVGLLLILAIPLLILRIKKRTTSYTLSNQQDKLSFKLIRQSPNDDHFYGKTLELKINYYEITLKRQAAIY